VGESEKKEREEEGGGRGKRGAKGDRRIER
jgi:hypothetical protein